MKISCIVLITALGYVSLAQQNLPRCSNIHTRKEVRSMPQNEWNVYTDVVKRMNDDGWTAWFSYVHTANFVPIHGNSMFFPFHRKFLQDYESIGRRNYNNNFYLPYWDAGRDYSAPQRSAVLTDRYVGGNGRGNNRCVNNGFVDQLQVAYPNRHCLARQFDGPNNTIQTWYSPEYVASRLQANNRMAGLRPDIEYSIHGNVHIGIGGDMSQEYSPNDPIFMLHHANMDRLWARWQGMGDNLWKMDGPGPNGIRNLDLDDEITNYNIPIRTVMELGYGDMCYQYGGSSSSNSPQDSRARTASFQAAFAQTDQDGDPTGSSDQDLDSEDVVINKVRSNGNVSPEVAKLFGVSTNSNNARRSLYRRAVKPTTAKNNCTIIVPQPFPDSWISMHKYNKVDIQNHYKVAKEFIETLNKYKYVPAYC
ncbi:hypothetical protein H4219_003821 [Mycoemilia scoparia]|uniref:Tyrosinase copper-binding domain-containing protein n=1 Tax=Mycoemilia scoparia TaxID=417184 RepID=A0A9W8DNR2_9FUNG|nr:hypothetical protein H4219_003821 [Mycoemilia scoparia]